MPEPALVYNPVMRLAATTLFAVTFLLVVAAPAAGEPAESLEQQFERFLDWFPGRYDSALQTRIDALEGVPEAERNYRRHSIFRRVALPAFGDVVFYAEQYRDGDPAQVYRQRIYELSIDEGRRAIRLRVHVPDEVEPLRGAYRDPGLLRHLTPEATTVWPGCDLWWQWMGDHFRGALDPGACRFESAAFGQEIVLDEYLLLGSDYIQFADRGLALDGSYLFGMRGAVPNISLAVRPFLCLVKRNGETEVHWMHDQGGQLETTAGTLTLQRWNVRALGDDAGPFNPRQPDAGLQLVLEGVDGVERARGGSASVEERRVELTHGTLAVVCRRARDRLYDDGR